MTSLNSSRDTSLSLSVSASANMDAIAAGRILFLCTVWMYTSSSALLNAPLLSLSSPF